MEQQQATSAYWCVRADNYEPSRTYSSHEYFGGFAAYELFGQYPLVFRRLVYDHGALFLHFQEPVTAERVLVDFICGIVLQADEFEDEKENIVVTPLTPAQFQSAADRVSREADAYIADGSSDDELDPPAGILGLFE
jgi:hypothetical protein